MRSIRKAWLAGMGTVVALAWGGLAAPASDWPAPEDFGFLSWDAAPPYFLRQAERTNEPRVLWVETGRYALAVDTRSLALPHAGPMRQSREQALISDRAMANALPPGALSLSVMAKGELYTCSGLDASKDTWRYPVRIIETGHWLQHVDLDNLVFHSRTGRKLDAQAHLELAAWPDRVTFFAEVIPSPAVSNLTVLLKVSADRMKVETPATASTQAMVTLLAPGAGEERGSPPEVTVTAPDQATPVVRYRPDLDAWEVQIEGPAWKNSTGTYYPGNQLDRLDRWPVTLSNEAAREREVRLVFTRTTNTPITGLTPMWLDAAGFPTGLPVQLSKNWHAQPKLGHLRHEGPWVHACTAVRVPARSTRRLDFALAYARYGGIFAASHAQLSLIGWGHNQFWDEAAVGSFGESICFEPGRVQRRCFITDVRPLLVVHPPKTTRWEWTANVGGGDFLVYFDARTNYVPLVRTRTDYQAPGPCLTRTTYTETSADGAIAARATVRLPGANDHLRVYLNLRYDVRRDTPFTRLAFLQFGSDFYNSSWPGKFARGDAGGLIEEWAPGEGAWKYGRRGVPLAGAHPWLSAHEERLDGSKGEGGGTRGLILRAWRARLGGREAGPHLAEYLTADGAKRFRTALELAPPAELTQLKAGDFVEADVEWCVFPRRAADYYGSDEPFRDFLQANADTWKPVHREATTNAVAVKATRGTLESLWPPSLRLDARQEAVFTVTGGLGQVPVTFIGLSQARDWALTRNDRKLAESAWQTEYHEASKSWRVTTWLPEGGCYRFVGEAHSER